MSDLYQNTNTGDVYAASEDGLHVTSHAQQDLYSSKGWVRFMSVLGFISFAGMVFGTIATMTMIGNIGGFGGFGVISFLLMLTMTVVTFMFSLRLTKFASAIGRMQLTRDRYAFEAAMIEQMKFWRLMGILTMIWLVLAVIGLITG